MNEMELLSELAQGTPLRQLRKQLHLIHWS